MEDAITIIDVWNVGTFDDALRAKLDQNADLVRSYVNRENAIFLEHDYSDKPRRSMLRPENEHAAAYIRFVEHLMAIMNERTIRAWHYTRMTDDDVARFRTDGILLSSPELLRERLDRIVATGLLAADQAERLWQKSPFNSDQGDLRAQRFYLTSHPQRLTCSGVRGLLGFWGGEVASFFVQDQDMAQPLSTIGVARVIEVATPINTTRNAYHAAQAVTAAYARQIGCVEDAHGFDVCVLQRLPADAVLRIHTRGEADFDAMIESYPPGYVDVDETHWRDLTGEED